MPKSSCSAPAVGALALLSKAEGLLQLSYKPHSRLYIPLWYLLFHKSKIFFTRIVRDPLWFPNPILKTRCLSSCFLSYVFCQLLGCIYAYVVGTLRSLLLYICWSASSFSQANFPLSQDCFAPLNLSSKKSVVLSQIEIFFRPGFYLLPYQTINENTEKSQNESRFLHLIQLSFLAVKRCLCDFFSDTHKLNWTVSNLGW